MTKKHFEAFAYQIATSQQSEATRRQMAEMVASVARADNPRFDRDRFFRACRLG